MNTVCRGLACALILGAPVLRAADATEEKEWTSTAGTKVMAAAVAVEGEAVRLRKPDGVEIVVPLVKFVPEDRALLENHFQIEAAPPGAVPGATAGKSVPLATELAHPVGQVSGPHDAGGGSTYFIYIPKSLKEKRKAPLLLYTGSMGGTAKHVTAHIKGAEVNGWIVAANVESRNKTNEQVNHAHAERCVDHLLKTLPIDSKRLYFTGSSGGGAMAFTNAFKLRAAGAMPIIGYSLEREYPKGAHYYVMGGASDFNRYMSADAADAVDDRGFHRMYPGGHSDPAPWIRDEAMTWLNGRYLEAKKADRLFADERLDWEASVLAWIEELKAGTPYRAYVQCLFLRDTHQISGPNAAIVAALAKELAADPLNRRYAEGMAELDDFSGRYFTGHGFGSKSHHTTPKIQAASAKLMEKYTGVPHVEETAKHLGYATAK